MIDVSVIVRAFFPGVAQLDHAELVTINQWYRPVISAKSEVSFTIRPELLPEREHWRANKVIQAAIAEAIASGLPVDLLQLLQAIEGAELRVYVFGNDSLSGARGYATATYRAQDIVDGVFKQRSIVVAPAGVGGPNPLPNAGSMHPNESAGNAESMIQAG